jgi:hypothetical protein
MSWCICRFILAVLVIVFAWWAVDWANIALTVIGALLAILALTGWCCRNPKAHHQAPPAEG